MKRYIRPPDLFPSSIREPSAEETAAKAEYRHRLAEALQDPAFRQQAGFPLGSDEDILALSDPPYYTACPNPFLGEILAQWQAERAALRHETGLPDDDPAKGGLAYRREPFAADVSEGKNDPIYNAHSYHTKVPHRAIMRYILHYTDPGDIVFDGFCGTGMTGVAAQLCGDRQAVESLGYTVRKDGTILDEAGKPFSRLGARRAVLNDLSPAATFIAYNYNTPVDAAEFEREAHRILDEVEAECGWMYETYHAEPSDVSQDSRPETVDRASSPDRVRQPSSPDSVQRASSLESVSRASSPADSALSRLLRTALKFSPPDFQREAGSLPHTADNLDQWDMASSHVHSHVIKDGSAAQCYGEGVAGSTSHTSSGVAGSHFHSEDNLDLWDRASSPIHTPVDHSHAIKEGITDLTIRQGDLPHWQLPGAHYFLTFDTHNHRILSDAARKITLDALKHWDGDRLDLVAAVIMPDHMHAILVPRQKDDGTWWDLSRLLHSIKSFTANEINKVEGKQGQAVWMSETYDHIIRDEHQYQRILTYIAHNPYKAQLAADWQEYEWLYLGDALRDGWKPSPLGRINYTVWSDVFACPQCGAEMVFWDVAVDSANGAIRDNWNCPGCQALMAKAPRKDSGALRAERAFETRFDRELGETVRQAKQVPVLINYSVGKKRFEKRPDADDLALIKRIEESDIPYPVPTDAIPKGDKTSDPFNVGITHVHHFYTRRNLWVLATSRKRVISSKFFTYWMSLLRGSTSYSTKLVKVNVPRLLNKGGLFSFGAVTGTLYVPSLNGERPIIDAINGKFTSAGRIFSGLTRGKTLIGTQDSSIISLPADSLDYIFIDPPFGANLMYSELNFLWEAWLGVKTANTSEAIINKTQRKGLPEYQGLMEACFAEYYRLLKPGRWMTVEFHNSQNAVWNAIQEALLRAGFIVAEVATLDKQQGTFNQENAAGAVQQDIIISAYKPGRDFEQRFAEHAGTPLGAWDFIHQHLSQLALPQVQEKSVEVQGERMPFLLYDRLVAFHLVRGLPVPLSAGEFYLGLAQRYLERDGMYFTTAHAASYDQLRLRADRVQQMVLFVSDEHSAIQWLRQTLAAETGKGPLTYGDLYNDFLQALQKSRFEALPELKTLLEENFVLDAEGRWLVPDPDNQAQMEQVRTNGLLREFRAYLATKGKLKVFRSEAIRAGFSQAWKDREYAVIVEVAERLPEQVLQDDAQLSMYVNNALGRAARQPKQERLI